MGHVTHVTTPLWGVVCHP